MKVLDGLDKIVKANSNSYHHLLRDAYIQAPSLLLGSEWPDTQKLLYGRGLSILQLGDETVLRSRCLVQNSAVKFPSGHSLDLYLEMEAPRGERDQFGFPAPGRVTMVCIGLEGQVDEPFSEVREERMFLSGTVLDTILQSEDRSLMQVVKDHSTLEYVDITYGYAGDKGMKAPCWGFKVIFTFASEREPSRKSKLFYSVESGLDLGLRTAVQIAQRDKLGRVRQGKAFIEAGDQLLPVDDWQRQFGDIFPGFEREDKVLEIACSGKN
jgi:hypothetical protein